MAEKQLATGQIATDNITLQQTHIKSKFKDGHTFPGKKKLRVPNGLGEFVRGGRGLRRNIDQLRRKVAQLRCAVLLLICPSYRILLITNQATQN